MRPCSPNDHPMGNRGLKWRFFFDRSTSNIQTRSSAIVTDINRQNEKGQAFLPDLFTMGRVMGFEPTAPRATIWCSNRLSYTRHRVARFIWPEACYVKRIISLFYLQNQQVLQSADFCGLGHSIANSGTAFITQIPLPTRQGNLHVKANALISSDQ